MRMYRYCAVISIIVLISFSGAYAQTFSPTDAVEAKNTGSINWTMGEVYATGIGAPSPQAVNAAQARAMAERAATVVAYRNLLETVKGVRVDSETVVENFMVRSDVIRTQVDGIVKGARIVKKQNLPDGSVEVLVAMPMKGAFMNAIVPENFGRTSDLPPALHVPLPQKPSDIKPQQKPEPAKPAPAPPSPPAAEPTKPMPAPEKKAEPQQPAPVVQAGPSASFKGGVATGLVIDGRGLGLRPALLPKILDDNGREIYVGQVVTRTNAVEQGVAGYAKDVNAAANNFRVTDNPVIIKGARAAGASRTDIMLAQADAETLRNLGGRGEFLQYCRVIIVY